MSPELPPAWSRRTSEEIASPPSDMAVQSGPSLPSARANPSTRWSRSEAAVQVTVTLVTLEEGTVPAPLDTVQIWPAGLVATVTL